MKGRLAHLLQAAPTELPLRSPNRRHVKGRSRDIYGAGVGHGLAWDTSPHPGAMMNLHTQHRYRVVTLRFAQGLSRFESLIIPLLESLCCHPERSEGSLSTGTEMLRCAQHDSIDSVPCCHPERSEGSLSMGTEMLRFAQHDSTDPE